MTIVLIIISISCIWLSGYVIGRYFRAKWKLRKLEEMDKKVNDLLIRLRRYEAMGGYIE